MPTKTRINGENYSQLPRLVSDDIILNGLPQTPGAPAGYGDLASAVHTQQSISAPAFFGFNDASDVQTVTGSPTYEFGIAPNGYFGVKVTCTSSVAVKFPKATGQFFDGNASLVVIGGKASNIDSVTVRVYENQASNVQNFKQTVFASSPLNNFIEQGGAVTIFNSKLSWGISGTPSATYNIDDMRITIAPTAGQTGGIWLLGYSTVFRKRKSRICITYDDGYDSLFTLGLSPWATRGIPVTLGAIPSAVDDNLLGYASLPQLKSLAGGGNAIVAHQVGDIIAAMSPAQFAEDLKETTDWIRSKGLATDNFDKAYIWPQAKFQNTTGDTSYLDKASAAGITVGRGANTFAASSQRSIDALSKYNRLAMPVIGHNWAGTTAAEATNIANIVSYINSVADNGGLDVFLVLHKVVPDSTPDGSMTLSIRISDLNTIAAAVKAKIDAGLLDAVTMPQLAITSSNYWSEL